MKQRVKILRKCIFCQKESLIRKDGAGKSCRSCRAKENARSRIGKPLHDLSGLKFGKLTVFKGKITDSFFKYNNSYYWFCICDCGSQGLILGNRLISGKTKSCGCITRSQRGLSTTPTYRSWNAMMQRCYDSKVSHYARYGAKGIIVCDRWKSSFLNFLEDMGFRPKNTTLDRIDFLGNYNPENCRWRTYKQQANNTTKNKIITYLGKSQTLTQWSEEIGIGWSTLRKRIYVLKWPIEKALLQEIRNGKEKEI